MAGARLQGLGTYVTNPDNTTEKLDNEEVETRKEENAIRDEHALPARINTNAP